MFTSSRFVLCSVYKLLDLVMSFGKFLFSSNQCILTRDEHLPHKCWVFLIASILNLASCRADYGLAPEYAILVAPVEATSSLDDVSVESEHLVIREWFVKSC